MKYLIVPISAMAAALILASCGSGESPGPVEGLSASHPASGFVLKEGVTVSAMLEPQESQEERVFLPAGTELLVLESRNDSEKGGLIRLGVDANLESGLPSDLWVRSIELPDSILQPIAPGEEGEEAEEEGSLFAVARKKMTYCYRYVKLYLLETGKVKVYLPGGSAYQAYSILPKHGFRLTENSPKTAREGEVCVYAGGPKGHGHIEVKRNGKWWYGYGFKANPIANRKFLGCFFK